MVIDQTPKMMRRTKLPIVKAKIGPKISILIADEKILLRQLKEGSHQAFQRLYESYFDLFYGLFSLYTVRT